jgi:hypothetical protein
MGAKIATQKNTGNNYFLGIFFCECVPNIGINSSYPRFPGI